MMMYKVGERISSLRRERNMSQEELATILNVSRQTISKWETGETLPDVYNAVAIAKLFHVSLDVLILGANNSSGESSYMSELKTKRHNTNLWAIIIGAIGSTSLVVASILLKTLDATRTQVGITMAFVVPLLMFCWGYAIWGFIKVARIQNEIKYLEKIEMMNLMSDIKNPKKE